MNVLFVGAGRRVSLAEEFIKCGFTVLAYELGFTVPISSVSVVVKGLKFNDPHFQTDIRYAIKNYKIDLVVPLQDDAVHKCSMITNCKVACSGTAAAEICLDKALFEKWCLVNVPQHYPKNTGSYPKIYKPKFGFGSRGILIVKNQAEEPDKAEIINHVVQKFIVGKEYSVDAYFNRNSKMVDCVPRERIRVANGEVLSSKTVEFKELQKITKLIGQKMKLKGPTCFQYIVGADNKPYIMEINARFGGGAVLSMYAGLPMVEMIKNDLFNYEYEYKVGSWKRNILMERANREFYYET